MARLLGPDANGRQVYRVSGADLKSAAGLIATVYSDAAGSVLADIAAYDSAAPATPGTAISGSQLIVDAYSRLPLFWFPADGTDTLYVTVDGGPLVTLHADFDARLDAITSVGSVGGAAGPLDSGGHLPVSQLPDATSGAKGAVRLAGDLGGTATSPTVPGLTGKEPTVAAGTTGQYYRGDKSWQALNSAAVGLGNVPNVDATARANHTGTQLAATISDLPEAVQDIVGAALAAGANISVTYDDTAGTITLAATGLTPTTRQILAGTGLSGGGDLTADRTLIVTYGTTSGTAAQGNDSRIAGAVQASTVDAKGDLLVGTADNTIARQAVGTDGYSLVADSTQAAGVKWAARSNDVQVFTGSGTWTKPAGAVAVHVVCHGGGGGGGSGRRGAAGSVRCGGGGGGGGGASRVSIQASLLPSTVAVTVGASGAGGAAVSSDSTDGNNGVDGGSTLFGTYVRASGGFKGQAGTASTGTGGALGVGTVSGGTGASASATGGGGSQSSTVAGATGGGSGGGVTSADAVGGGGGAAGSTTGDPSTASGGVAGGASPAAGSSQPTNSGLPGNGGGAGAASITAAAQAGAAGGLYGGGGGGGGASLNGNNSGAGGAGGAGICIVTTSF